MLFRFNGSQFWIPQCLAVPLPPVVPAPASPDDKLAFGAALVPGCIPFLVGSVWIAAGGLPAAPVLSEILIKRIHMLSTGVLITTELVRGRPLDNTVKTLGESKVLLEAFETLIARHEQQNARGPKGE